MRVNRTAMPVARPQRWPAPLTILLVFLTILAGCGGGAATPAVTTGTAPTTAAGASPTTAAPATTAATTPPAAQGTAATGPSTTAGRTATTTRAQSTAFPMQAPHLSYGMNLWLPGTDMDRTLTLLTDAGFGWARQWISWESVEPAQGSYSWDTLDKVVAAAQRHNVQLLVVFPKAPAWASPNGGIPRDKTTYARFLSAVATRYKGKIAAYEIWNEQNLAGETGGQVNVGEYVELLKAVFPSIKAADPGAFVLYGGLTPNGVNNPAIAIDDVLFLQQCYAYNGGEIRQYFDALAAHPGGMNNPPEALWPENPGPGPGFFDHRSFYFRRFEDLRQVMEDAGDGAKQIWLTEFGWTTKNEARGYEYGQYNSEQDQANYLVAAYQLARENYPYIGVMIMWNLNYSTISKPDDEKTPWSIVNADYSPRPAYRALKEMPK